MTNDELLTAAHSVQSMNTIIVDIQGRVEQAVRAVTNMAATVAQIAQYQAALATEVEQQLVRRELAAILQATANAQSDRPI